MNLGVLESTEYPQHVIVSTTFKVAVTNRQGSKGHAFPFIVTQFFLKQNSGSIGHQIEIGFGYLHIKVGFSERLPDLALYLLQPFLGLIHLIQVVTTKAQLKPRDHRRGQIGMNTGSQQVSSNRGGRVEYPTPAPIHFKFRIFFTEELTAIGNDIAFNLLEGIVQNVAQRFQFIVSLAYISTRHGHSYFLFLAAERERLRESNDLRLAALSPA